MVKKTKKGKDRLDKYYHLAKDQGYRARSAFKLIQLAKKYDFLTKSNICIDLCGAPGGWSQVAQKNMPMGSQIICVDLVPIKPLHGVTSIASDVTTSKCRDLIRKEMKGQKADVVLNDGAPNVGASWAKDAFSQNELTLSCFKVACEHLKHGGTFVSKVFRSADYNSLLWVFNQLFEKVEATKPQASRAVSAEIFVLCTNYKAPSKIDPKFFDSKFVFMETMEEDDDGAKKSSATLADLLKSQTKKKRTATEEDKAIQILDAYEFIISDNPAILLTTNQKMVFQSEEAKELLKDPLTTEDLQALCEDLKILGKRDLTLLVKWRFKIKRQYQKKLKEERMKAKGEAKASKKEGDDEDDESEQGVDDELDEVLKKRKAEEKAARKKDERLQKKKEWRKKMSLNGVFTIQDEMDLFKKNAKNVKALKDESKYITPVVEEFTADPKEIVSDESDSESEDEDELDRLARMEVDMAVQLEMRKNEDESRNKERRKEKLQKETRRQRVTTQWAQEMESFTESIDQKAAEDHARKQREDMDSEDEAADESKGSDDDGEEDANDDGDDGDDDDAEADKLEEPKSKRRRKGEPEVPKEETWRADKRADRWFSQDVFSGIKATGSDDDFDPEQVHKDDDVPELSDDDLPQMPLSDKQKRAKKRKKQQERLKYAGVIPEKEKSALEIVPAPAPTPLDEPEVTAARGPQKPEDPYELAETMAMGSLMIQKKSRMDLIDSAFNRWTYDTMEGLPSWFADEENKFNTPELPVSKELMAQFRDKLKEINARPIRKVAEAQGRKRKRLQHRIEKLRKTAQMLMESGDMSEGAKANQMKKLVSKSKRNDQRKISYVALKKGGGGRKVDKSKAPKGAKVKVVDRRMRSDTKALKRVQKKMDKHGRSKIARKAEKRSKKRRGNKSR